MTEQQKPRFDMTISLGHLLTAGSLLVSVVLAYADLAAAIRTEREHRQVLTAQVQVIQNGNVAKEREDREMYVSLARLQAEIAALREELRRALSRADRTDAGSWLLPQVTTR